MTVQPWNHEPANHPALAKQASWKDATIDSLVKQFLSATSGGQLKRCRRALLREDVAAVTPALIDILNRAAKSREFDRTARLLAAIASEEAFEALTMQARVQRRYPKLAVRALACCQHPMTVPTLIDLLEHGRIKQRRAATKGLARTGSAYAIRPLCRYAALGLRDIGPESQQALREMGNTAALARKILAEPAFTMPDRLQSLHALTLWSPNFMGFNAQRFLDREGRSWLSPVRNQARDTAKALREQSTLLRPTETVAPSVLLRPASGPITCDSEKLLRAAEFDDDDDDSDFDESRGIFQTVVSRFAETIAGISGLIRRPLRSPASDNETP